MNVSDLFDIKCLIFCVLDILLNECIDDIKCLFGFWWRKENCLGGFARLIKVRI